MLTKKNSKRDIPPWVDSPYNTFDKPLPPEPPDWSSGPINNFDKRTGKEGRFGKARNQAEGFWARMGVGPANSVAFVSSIICCPFVSEWTLSWTLNPKPS